MASRGFPSLTALLGLLAVAGYQNRDKIAEIINNFGKGGAPGQIPGQQPQSLPPGQTASAPGQPSAGPLSGLDKLLAGVGGAAGAGGLLSGGLGELIEQFKNNGQGKVADSWVGTGQNEEISPPNLQSVLGPEITKAIAQATGMSEQEILQRLSTVLPSAVDQYTPGGRLPQS
ncbi:MULTISPECIES: YidB family protein [unclassified Beijerinckia]|uniref:YidB family protein n=1 Tax=unclassified Beijerinckia TaxID=2638183 RepID=UPI00089DA220|nr:MULTISPECIES: YidB family protein [unclassified Beijerinckia]MDH7794067.1 uncharacterized protein YidB (DUF937 family) [Beijerinckia sp. GAS462]SEB52557.1 Uncharacterized conserved protein YidB, DUF937 family [Beijerinckia sp. 28-YEA-48]